MQILDIQTTESFNGMTGAPFTKWSFTTNGVHYDIFKYDHDDSYEVWSRRESLDPLAHPGIKTFNSLEELADHSESFDYFAYLMTWNPTTELS